MITLKDDLTERVNSWAALGHPAMLDRFILRNGKAYTPAKRIGHKRKPKQCFGNAAQFVLNRNPAKPVTYVEGYVICGTLPIPIHHAWVSMNGTDAMDPTLDAENYQYFGVAFDPDTVRKELIRSGVYGVLDHGLGFNTKLMFKIDPELEAICASVKRDPTLMKLVTEAMEKAQ